MEEHRGIERGSYIWGRGFGSKWKLFFMDLERHHSLDTTIPAHIWLLHHLFVHHINQDALEWAEAWNSHRISLPGGQSRSPRDMFIFGVLEHGAQGVEERLRREPSPESLQEFGIDWGVLEDRDVMAHFQEHNGEVHGTSSGHAFAPGTRPERLSEVICNEPNCPFTLEQIQRLDAILLGLVDTNSRDMNVRQTVWSSALQICLSNQLDI
ncbi:hypothetical protein C2E23DRAFT_867706 [Lenzites betulinus]|nr:hypothetical protein C2E23DRAFT_867706 [Lenzites betulinus]